MASAASPALTMLFDLASEEAAVAAKQLAIANKVLKEAQAKSEMLNSYKQNYIDHLNSQLASGMGKEAHLNYQKFLDNLQQAQTGQDEVLIAAEYECSKARTVLQAAQRKKMSYEVLIDRANKKAVKLANKRDQNMMDEFAMRSKRGRH